jgi:hypothetical protein
VSKAPTFRRLPFVHGLRPKEISVRPEIECFAARADEVLLIVE